jgi:hypothetical protein
MDIIVASIYAVLTLVGFAWNVKIFGGKAFLNMLAIQGKILTSPPAAIAAFVFNAVPVWFLYHINYSYTAGAVIGSCIVYYSAVFSLYFAVKAQRETLDW